MIVPGLQWIVGTVAGGVYHHLEWRGILLVVFVVLLSIFRAIQILCENRKVPPGPWGFPIIGYLPLMKGDSHLHYNDLARKYGAMFSTRLGNQLVVVLSDHKTIREAFRKEEFTGRPHTEFMNILEGYGKS
jgi:26-hydroxylase